MLTKDPNKVGYSGLECPDDHEETKSYSDFIYIDVEQYVEANMEVSLPHGYTAEDVELVYYDCGNAIVSFKDGKTIDAGEIPDLHAHDGMRFRVYDEDQDNAYYDSWN